MYAESTIAVVFRTKMVFSIGTNLESKILKISSQNVADLGDTCRIDRMNFRDVEIGAGGCNLHVLGQSASFSYICYGISRIRNS